MAETTTLDVVQLTRLIRQLHIVADETDKQARDSHLHGTMLAISNRIADDFRALAAALPGLVADRDYWKSEAERKHSAILETATAFRRVLLGVRDPVLTAPFIAQLDDAFANAGFTARAALRGGASEP